MRMYEWLEMEIQSLRNFAKYGNNLSTPDSSRKIGLLGFQDILFTGRNTHYPNLLLQGSEGLINPYDERVMSLKRDSFYDGNLFEGKLSIQENTVEAPVFFFAYNVDNYFHFLYDTLPYLYYYLQLRAQYPNCKLLMATSHPTKASLPLFVQETLDLLDCKDILFIQPNTLYSRVYVGLSMTHGGQSNDPPHPFANTVWQSLVEKATYLVGSSIQPIEKVYISRRSWLSKHPENIGTNYTTRRKCVNEDELVAFLQEKGYQELFCEDLSMAEKIFLFAGAKEIVGVIGGGMSNAVFCKKETRVHCLVTPCFLEINARFEHSMNPENLVLYRDCCPLASFEGKYSLYVRAKILDTESPYFGKVGEICASEPGRVQLQVSRDGVAGFSQDFAFDSVWIEDSKVDPLDAGLNSPYMCILDRFKHSFQG